MAEMTVSAEALKALCVALGEPYETPSGHPMEPPYQMTWERALDLVRGRTAAWASFLTRIEEVDPAWLNEQRSRAGSRTSTVASATESVDTATAEAPTRTEPDRLTGATIPINPDGTTDWPRFAAELRTGHDHADPR